MCNSAGIVLAARKCGVFAGLRPLSSRVLLTLDGREYVERSNSGGKLRTTQFSIVLPLTHCEHHDECGVLITAYSNYCRL